jgi:c-di-GMP-binding flagellar brake protein YcgR
LIVSRRGSERRRFVRVDDNLVASVEQVADGPTDALTLNFSAGGVLMLLDHYVEPSTPLRVALQLEPGEQPLEFSARVVRTRTLSDHSHEVAAEFVGGSAADQRRLQDEIARRTTRAPAPPPLTA